MSVKFLAGFVFSAVASSVVTASDYSIGAATSYIAMPKEQTGLIVGRQLSFGEIKEFKFDSKQEAEASIARNLQRYNRYFSEFDMRGNMAWALGLETLSRYITDIRLMAEDVSSDQVLLDEAKRIDEKGVNLREESTKLVPDDIFSYRGPRRDIPESLNNLAKKFFDEELGNIRTVMGKIKSTADVLYN